MCFWSDITAVQDYEMYYINTWLKRCVFNLDECVWTPNIIRKAIPEFGSQIWKNSTLFSGFCYLSTKSRDGYHLHFIDTILLIDTGAYRYCHYWVPSHRHFFYHCYADDTQLYISFQPDDPTAAARTSGCLADISAWMKEHHLQLNLAKTELLVFPATPTLQHDFTIQ